MRLGTSIRSFLRNVFFSTRQEVELDEEVRAHLDLLTEENIQAGMTPEHARRAARMELGGVEQVKEEVRQASRGNWLRSVLADVSYGLRQFRHHPGITAIMVFTLALAIGATTAIFSVVYGVLLRPLPYKDAGRIVALFEVNSQGTWSRLADPNFNDFQEQSHSFEAIAKYHADIASVSGPSQPTRTMVAAVSPDFLKVFAIQPVLGRDFTVSDAKKGAHRFGQLRILEAVSRIASGSFAGPFENWHDGFCCYWGAAGDLSFPDRRGFVGAGGTGGRKFKQDVA